MENSQLIINFFQLHNLPPCVAEYRFAPPRKFRFDYAFIDYALAVECEGGIYMKKSGHNTASGILRDIAKYNLAATLGFTVLRFTPQTITTESAIDTIKAVIERKKLHPVEPNVKLATEVSCLRRDLTRISLELQRVKI